MTFKSFCLALAALSLMQAAPAATPLGPLKDPLWMRYSAISPDSREIAFAFEGNLFVVPTGGGMARLLVSNGHHSTQPVWSPDGHSIAYASDVHGNFDVYLVAADGGPSRRLTTNSASELPIAFTPDGSEVLFSAQRMDARTSMAFPSPAMGELYEVSVEGGRRPVQIFSTPALAGRFDKTGTDLVYEDWKGYENLWRKHHVSPVSHDIWVYDTKTGQHHKLTSGGVENRNPVWAPDQKTIYFLSERSGSFNVWKMPVNQPEAATQVTHLSKNPVRFLSIADSGELSFGYDGELYTLAPGETEPSKVAVQITADTLRDPVETLQLSSGATEIAPNPDGQEYAFVDRGQIFVTSTEFGNTRRITSGPGQKRSVQFSPDGRSLVFAGEQDGHWALYTADIVGDKKDVPYFFNAAQVKIAPLLDNEHQNFQPRWSPDGREVAYLEDRVTLKVLNLASHQSRVVLPGNLNYSYSDGDQWFDWSPDGKSLLVTFLDRTRDGNQVGLVAADGASPVLNLTHSGYNNNSPLFARQGQLMIWLTDRTGLHGAGGEAQDDVFAMFFTRAAYDRYQLDKAEYALLKKREDDAKKDEGAKDSGKNGKKEGQPDVKDAKAAADKDADAIKLPAPVTLERAGLDDRVARLTPNSGDIQAAVLTPDGETLYYVVKTADAYELWSDQLRDHEAKRVTALPAGQGDADTQLRLDAKGDTGFMLAGDGLYKFKVPADEGDAKVEPLHFSAELRIDHAAERAQMFDHVWRQTQEKLYVTSMNGVDWAGYRKVYEKFLPDIADNYDFAELLSEMLGELDVSHTGSGYRPHLPDADATASLGVFYDPAYTGAGAKISEVIEGGPLDNSLSMVKAGMVIEAVGGKPIAAGAEFDSLLNHLVGQQVALSMLDPATGKHFEQTVKPISQSEQGELLYKRWVRAERAMVDKLSGGRLGYVHVRAMDNASYRDTYAEILGRDSGKEAEIVDTRFNGGGNLHDELATLLNGKRYLELLPRGQSLGWEPVGKWTKPSLVIISESNYSDAHLFPWVYRHLGIGKLVGMPVAGTGTAVWWETLQDRSLYFGIPEIAFRDAQGQLMENALITPDIEVPNNPAKLDGGEDQQLEAAVKALLNP